ncbi:FKBP-type peptidyl-prolyl cis-trans isomerase [Brachybacterium sp. p3-SID957]|uniref:FKBP-type peptidyl-prolyl cis-trans isomerase n=1 Tax=Brachybacterium sp. p3-SID957 TaxID=2916049 RepID=UPI00223AB69B|nr:FKBP-type peptidyl-prolyl cis-trans isomerase [Brachybacterium sp. p3-SID957]MCT1775386.1 FKBP-type peptidyl-prolyl cis-trans isomerase [Brachybacterium sp. p3-SID957]
MIRRRTLLSTALAATAAIGLAACSDDGTDPEQTGATGSDGGGEGAILSAVTVSEDLGSEPTVEFEAPLQVTAPDAVVVVPGDGETIAAGDTVIMRSAYVDASTGEMLQSWWQGAPAGGMQVDAQTIGEQAATFFTSVTVGSRFAMAGWQQSQTGQSMSLIQVGDIDRIVAPLRAEGKPQEPSGDFPAVNLGENGAPSLDGAPEGEPPTKTTRELLIEGTGDATREGDFLTMQYTGWAWDTGEQFDSSWDRGAPFSFVQGQGMVITGWDQHLLDVPVGSQVMLVIPPADAYGEDPELHELGGKTLVFVVDVLDAAHKIE